LFSDGLPAARALRQGSGRVSDTGQQQELCRKTAVSVSRLGHQQDVSGDRIADVNFKRPKTKSEGQIGLRFF
jgi:hypothetical protein